MTKERALMSKLQMRLSNTLAALQIRVKRSFVRHAPKPAIDVARRVLRRRKKAAPARLSTGVRTLADLPALRTPQTEPHTNLFVGCILDEFSFAAWSPEFKLVPIRPNTPREEIAKIDLLFVEAAWNGSSGAWKSHLVGKQAPSPALTDLLRTCRELSIPAVFWNKEDPQHFDDFLETAKLFDVVATTDASLNESYRHSLGHDRVIVLPFAAQPAIHNPARNEVGAPLSDVAFAGTYFRHKFPERRVQMNLLIGAAHTVAKSYDVSFTIYSRHDGGDNRYQFPDRWSSHVKGKLTYEQMLVAYRSHKVFLNVNSETSSPSMCSRRVFEICASGTPVITTGSNALRNFFTDDEVAIVDDQSDAEDMIRALVSSQNLRRKMVHRAQRRIWEQHTYHHRAQTVLESVGYERRREDRARVSVICSTNRDPELRHLLDQVAWQTYGDIELVVLGHGIEISNDFPNRAHKAGIENVTVLHAPSTSSLGECLNELVQTSTGDIIAKFDDDDYYLPNYIRDQVNILRSLSADVVGKASVYFYLSHLQCLAHRWPEKEHTWSTFVSGSTLVGWRHVFVRTPFRNRNVGEDSEFLIDLQRKGARIYSADSFNYLCIRGGVTHTWGISDHQILANSVVETYGLNLEHIEV